MEYSILTKDGQLRPPQPEENKYIGETKRRLKDRFNEHRRPVLNPTGNYIHTAVSAHFLTRNHSDKHSGAPRVGGAP